MQHAQNQIGYLLDHTFFRRFERKFRMEKHFYAIGKTYMVRKILQPGNTVYGKNTDIRPPAAASAAGLAAINPDRPAQAAWNRTRSGGSRVHAAGRTSSQACVA